MNNYSNGITFGYILSSIFTLGGTAMARGEKARVYFECKFQILSNSTVTALIDIATQLESMQVYSDQTKCAVDFMLAKSGGVCAIIGDQCVMSIENLEKNITQHIKDIIDNVKGMESGIGVGLS